MRPGLHRLCLLLATACCLLTGCGLTNLYTQKQNAQKVVEESQAASNKSTNAESQQSQKTTPPATAKAVQPVAIITDDTKASQALERAIRAALNPATGGPGSIRFSLQNAPANIVADLVRERGLSQIVAIGPHATKTITPSAKHQVVFTAVENGAALQKAGYLGVESVPSYALQLQAWREARPQISSIGVLASAEFADHLQAIENAGSDLGLKVVTQIVASDREAEYVLAELRPSINAFIFLPDPKILTPQFVLTVHQSSADKPIALLAYTPAVIKLPGVDSVGPAPEDIAEQVIGLLSQTISPHGASASSTGYKTLSTARINPTNGLPSLQLPALAPNTASIAHSKPIHTKQDELRTNGVSAINPEQHQ